MHGKFSAFQSLDGVLALAAIAFRPEVDGEGLMNNLIAITWKLWKLSELELQ